MSQGDVYLGTLMQMLLKYKHKNKQQITYSQTYRQTTRQTSHTITCRHLVYGPSITSRVLILQNFRTLTGHGEPIWSYTREGWPVKIIHITVLTLSLSFLSTPEPCSTRSPVTTHYNRSERYGISDQSPGRTQLWQLSVRRLWEADWSCCHLWNPGKVTEIQLREEVQRTS